ncbi:damage-control phosphatase ARMT1 family protein [Glycomyces endophyticus]|uniref:damage-control phosphatase ARMT1 family protein n=1 Tax=Glycomyces endophyticus TaxID=480996 RepID=UPI0031D4AA09
MNGVETVQPDLPPPIGIDRPGSFSRSVFHERHPVLIANLLGDLPYPPEIADALEALLAESLAGTVPARTPGGPEIHTWHLEVASHAGRTWDSLPFLWAESYFYRRLLRAVEYHHYDSPWCGTDPFAPQKHAQLDGPELRADLDAYAALSGAGAADRRRALLLAALWGNQADLGFRTNNPGADTAVGELLADDADALWALAEAPGDAPVIIVADNAGREITADLALVDHLLETATGPVELHLKPHPYFVSDATGQDLVATLDALDRDPHQEVRDLGGRLRDAIRLGWLRLRTHGAYVHPTEYRTLPTDLAAEFAAAKLVILKGDLNYRRLVGDRRWDPATPFAEAAGYFPGPVAALRTAKSDLAVGVDPARLAELDAAAPDWRLTGTRAFIQVHA